MELCAIKWVSPTIAIRNTNEVSLRCEILDEGRRINLTGTADLKHHLVEDAAILLNKMAEEICGAGHGR